MTVDVSALGESALGRRFHVPETHGELQGLAIPAAVRLPTFSSAHPPNGAGTLETSQASQPQTGFPQLQGGVSASSWVRRDGSRSAVSRETMARFRRGNENSCVSYAVHKLATFPRRFDTPRDSRANRLDSGRPRYGPHSWGIWSFSPVSRETLQVPNTNWRNATWAV